MHISNSETEFTNMSQPLGDEDDKTQVHDSIVHFDRQHKGLGFTSIKETKTKQLNEGKLYKIM